MPEPDSLRKFRLRGLRAAASVAGRYQARDGNTVIGFFVLEANRWTSLLELEENGYLSAAANNALNFRNTSGSAADVDIVAWGSEE